jgi:hypothetical protein
LPSQTHSRVPSRAFTIPNPHGPPRVSNTHCARCTLPQAIATAPISAPAHALSDIVRLQLLTPHTHFPTLTGPQSSCPFTFDLADAFWRCTHLWTESFLYSDGPGVHWGWWPLRVGGIAFLPEVAEACLGVGVTCAAESHVYHCSLLCTLTCIYVAQITCICFVCSICTGAWGWYRCSEPLK